MRKQFDQWRALTGRERWLLVELAFLLPAIGGALRLLGVRRTYQLLVGGEGTATSGMEIREDAIATAERLGRLVNIASRHGPYNATCLRQSLALVWLLRRRGVPAELRIGVGKRAELVRAHAWVELAGCVINDSPSIADDYAAYDDLDRRLPNSFRRS